MKKKTMYSLSILGLLGASCFALGAKGIQNKFANVQAGESFLSITFDSTSPFLSFMGSASSTTVNGNTLYFGSMSCTSLSGSGWLMEINSSSGASCGEFQSIKSINITYQAPATGSCMIYASPDGGYGGESFELVCGLVNERTALFDVEDPDNAHMIHVYNSCSSALAIKSITINYYCS